MSERLLEVVRQPDGRFLASYDEAEPAVEVASWDDVRRIRAKRHLVDHWSDADRAAFIEQHGHPFDDWWGTLSPGCVEVLTADPDGPVPPAVHEEVKRTLRHQSRQAGLHLDGSHLSAEIRAYVSGRVRGAP